ncbi:MAG: hypothetical protein ACP5EN_04805 [Rhodovulum sp.]
MTDTTEDRDVLLWVPLKASQVEAAREAGRALAEFPSIIEAGADHLAETLMRDDIPPEEVGKQLGEGLKAMKANAALAKAAALFLQPLAMAGTFTDQRSTGPRSP